MKLVYIFLSLLAIYFVFQSFIAANAFKTEKQKYKTVSKDSQIEIRYYPAATMATIYSHATNYKGLANNGFRKLARFIFGGNDQKINLYKNKLLQILKERNIQVIGAYSFLGYNAPYQIIARTNEVIIPVEWKE